MQHEPDLARIATLIGEPTRASILTALMGGEALPASELAYRAGITPQTASSHLSKLLDGKLIQVMPQGRHRYYKLYSHEVAQILETLQLVAPMTQSVKKAKSNISPELCHARTCYDHLAGQLGVSVTYALLEKSYIQQADEQYILTTSGTVWLEDMGVDIPALHKKRRKFAYTCLDWSERRFHIGGALGSAIADVFFDKVWVKRLPHSRALQVTSIGQQGLRDELNVRIG